MFPSTMRFGERATIPERILTRDRGRRRWWHGFSFGSSFSADIGAILGLAVMVLWPPRCAKRDAGTVRGRASASSGPDGDQGLTGSGSRLLWLLEGCNAPVERLGDHGPRRLVQR